VLDQAQQGGPGRHQRLARLLLGQPVQAAIELTAVLVEEHLELGTGWLIDDILSERRWKGGHKQSISGAPPTSKRPLTGRRGRLGPLIYRKLQRRSAGSARL